jgi:hypothetical protein
MSKLAALGGALLMTLALTVPVAANQKMWMADFSGPYAFEVPVSIADGWFFECSQAIYYGGYGESDLWFWYPNRVDISDPDEYMPEGVAWPWIKGIVGAKGVDYFSSVPDMEGKVASGRYRTTTHLYDHHAGTPGDPTDLEWWHETWVGKNWGIQLPGYGTVFHESGNLKGKVTVVAQVPGPYDITEYAPLRDYRGNQTFDAEELCAFFGYDAIFP